MGWDPPKGVETAAPASVVVSVATDVGRGHDSGFGHEYVETSVDCRMLMLIQQHREVRERSNRGVICSLIADSWILVLILGCCCSCVAEKLGRTI